jgi:hypothetical protein
MLREALIARWEVNREIFYNIHLRALTKIYNLKTNQTLMLWHQYQHHILTL